MKFLGYIFITFIIILLSLFIIGKYREPKETVTIIGKEMSLERPWRKATEIESISINKSINKSDSYQDLYFKEINVNTFIIAGLAEDLNWDYYYAHAKSDKITPLSSEIGERISPP